LLNSSKRLGRCHVRFGSEADICTVWMRFCSFAVICFLVYVHLGPANWQPPRSGLGWQLDHFLGYFAATSIVWLAWPKRPFVVGGFLMVAAVLLEALQVFTPDRHADFRAALYGACGALTQALLAALFIRIRAAYYRHRFLKRQAL
jgi:VanZ family protein